MKVIGESKQRWDAIGKVQGKADYTDDIPMKNLLHGKVLRATIAHGFVKNIDYSEALKVEGVLKILTPDDVSAEKFPTAGHPLSITPEHKDIADRNILTKHVRLYGDEIAAVVAETELACEKALELIKVEYEELPFYLDPEDAIAEGAVEIHENTGNLIASTELNMGDIDAGFKKSDYIIERKIETPIVQHCHMEPQIAKAYMDIDGRWVCISSTQIPHICRRVLGEAFNMPLSNFRVIKPFLGGGFGNKQEVTIEPVVVAMSMAVNGRPVRYNLTREETMAYTRVRHAIRYKLKAGFTKEGKLTTLSMDAYSNNGAYASHGHSIAAKGGGILASLYSIENLSYRPKTIYTNTATAGAMRGYGVPQVIFAIESVMDDASRTLNIDPVEMRLKNILPKGVDHPASKLPMHTNELVDCIEHGKEVFEYDKKLAECKNFKSETKRRGVSLAAFSYATGVYPISLEMAGCRIVLNQDGRVKITVGATEIGQGSDTAFAQMVAETLSINYEDVILESLTDTDHAPFDTAAYASRQTLVSGMAVRKCAELLREKIILAAAKFYTLEATILDIKDSNIVYKDTGTIVNSLADLSLKTYYDKNIGECITAEVSNNFKHNNFPMGVTFAYVEVDIKTGKTDILSILNVHDSGIIINPLLAEGQVEGGMAMGVGYAIGEVLKYNEKNGKPLNNNLLDYKMPTIMDVPNLINEFIEAYEPTGPYGNKGLGEPPLCSPAAAIRNAILNATDVAIDTIPISPQVFFEAQNNIK
ncbi:MAG: xanthine dehydrogenase subunit XdhA [Lachnospirales bacterium]